MAFLSQASHLGSLLLPHDAFQEHAAHLAEWSAKLNSKGSESTCIRSGLTTFLPCAFTAHSDLVVDHWTSDVESSSHLDFLFLHAIWTPFGRLISCKITSIISMSCDFTTQSAKVLFARQPLGFDLKTWSKLLAPAQTPTAFFANAAAVVEEERQQLGGVGGFLLGFCACALGVAFVTRRRLATTVHLWTEALAAHVPLPYRPMLSATGRIAVVAFPPVLCLLLFLFVQALTEQEGPVLHFATQLLMLWMGATVLTHLAREVFLSPLVPAPHGAALFQCVRLMMYYAVCGLALLWGGTVLHLPPDMLALVRFLLILMTASSVFLLWSRKEAILALFPPLPNRLYQRFLTTLSAAYQPLLLLTFTTGLLWALGYQDLA